MTLQKNRNRQGKSSFLSLTEMSEPASEHQHQAIPNLFITGATGFVGANLVRYFARKTGAITASGQSDKPVSLPASIRYLRADIRRPLLPIQADIVVHAAALASDTATAARLQAANVDGARHVFEATQDCPVFIYISSSSVYSYRAEMHEENELVDYQALSPYGRSKRLAEDWLLQQDWSRRTLVILRPRVIYGVGDRQLLPRMMRLVHGSRICIPGSMRIQSSLTHVDNLCAAVEGCLQHFEACPGGAHIFNVADAEPYEMREAVGRLLSAVYGLDLPFLEMPPAPLHVVARLLERLRIPTSFTPFGLQSVSQGSALNLNKITETIGFRPALNLWEALPDLSAWANRVGLAVVRSGAPQLPWCE